jgi:hypothetical protein
MLHFLLGWLILYFIPWGIWELVKKKHDKHYITSPLYSFFYFIIWSGLAILLYWDLLSALKFSVSFCLVTLFILIWLVTIHIYNFIPKFYKRPDYLIKKYKNFKYLHMSKKFLWSKNGDLIFQQVMFAAMIIFVNQYISLVYIIILFTFIFVIMHSVLSRFGKLITVYYLWASITAGILFPIFIITLENGIIYSYLVHFIFYTMSATLAWLYKEVLKKKRWN